MTMRINDLNLKSTVRAAAVLAVALLFAAAAGFAQQQVNLTAGPTALTLPDGTTLPMWGYTCGTSVSLLATCAALNTNAPVGTWSPVVITIPTGQTLQINLTNNLSFTGGTVPTSLLIVGQLGGGLGTSATSTPATAWDHSSAQAATTWPIAGGAGGTPPTQGPRVQSFAGEVTAVAATTTPTCTVPAAGTPATGCGTLTWTAPRPGTYLLESGTHPSIQGPMGLYGMVVVTEAPSATPVAPATATTGCAYTPAAGTTCVVPYNAEANLLFSEIDPVQNNAVQTAVTTAGFSETMVWSGQPGGCGNPSSPTYHQCYPPAVNYTPLYYLINGVAFDKTHSSKSLFAALQATGITAGTGQVLVRMVNAGLRMHVPSIVGSQTGTAVAPALPPAGFSLIAEDGNVLPGVLRVQSEVFMAAGKTYDVMINAPAAGLSLPVYDRELSLSGNATTRDAGMLAYISVNGGGLPGGAAPLTASVQNITYNSLVAGQTLTVSGPSKGVISVDANVYGVQLLTQASGGTVTLNADGTFTYLPTTNTTAAPDSFTYCANGSVTGTTCSTPLIATVHLNKATLESASGITCTVPTPTYTSNVAATLSIAPAGVLGFCKDAAGYPLKVASATGSGFTLAWNPDGSFTATGATAGSHTLTFTPQNSQGTSGNQAIATLVFPAATNLAVTVKDPTTGATISDYRWIIEEDRTFYINPNCAQNPQPAGCPTFGTTGEVPTFGTNFHTSYMPVVAAGCVGTVACESGQTLLGQPAVCDIGNGVCRTTATQQAQLNPSQVHLDPTKRYYISVLPGDAANPFNSANAISGHGMGGAPIACTFTPTATHPACTSTDIFGPVTVLVEPTPFQTAKLTVFVFEDDFPLNGEQDAGGGIDVLATNEQGLGGFEITLFDDAGGTGDATGQLTHDMFNQPLSNSLAGTIDPATGFDACPIVTTTDPLTGVDSTAGNTTGSVGTLGITGRIVTCPKYEKGQDSSGNPIPSPLAGTAVVANMMPGRYGVVATPAADRIARGEEWLQTNTLDGEKAHDSFLRVAEPPYFQEFGPAGYHVSIGFANPKIINDRLAGVCNGTDPNLPGLQGSCSNTVKGSVSTMRMSRTPDERLYGSGSYDSFSFTQCFVSIGDPDGEDFAFTKCDGNGNFSLSGLPNGTWRITVFDQWNDMLVDGLSTPVALSGGGTVDMGSIAMNQWQANIYTSTFFDKNGNGVRDSDESGLTLVTTNIRFRDGSFSNFNNTDLSGNAGFNEIFPLFSWYVIETDSTRYKSTGTHVVYDAGGPSDGTSGCGGSTPASPPPCGTSYPNMANTYEAIPVPTNLRVPGAYYCDAADCGSAPSPLAPGGPGGSTGRVDPPWVVSEGWQGFSGQNNFIDFGKKPYCAGTGTALGQCGATAPATAAENGGIRGHVVYASTRPFDDPQLLLQTSWMPLVPNVTVNLYQEGIAPDGVTPTLKLVDTTKTSSWDDWAQGFRSDGIPNMNCPGQGQSTGTNADLFYFTLYQQPMYLNWYNNQHGGPAITPLPSNSQFKCYDGMHNWNQIQPAPYDGMYQFPSVTAIGPRTGKPTAGATNCTICIPNPDTTDPWRAGTPMLPAGKYVVEVVVPPGYELVKEEDKNILIGDNYIAPVTQEFGALGAIFIIPDQAAVGSTYNANNAQNPTTDLGSLPRHEGDTGSVESFWKCVGASRIVPDYISLFPQSNEVSPFAGATRNLCDRKEVTLADQSQVLAKFYIFSSTHVTAHFTGVITDDFTSEFDPFSPQFGEKFSPANLPISIRDFNNNEINRVYSDHWGTYDGLNYSTWEVNPPNPTGYAPTMMVTCMNDPGTGATSDRLYNPSYSNFCYEIPFMPAQTQYMDTPVVPTSAFAGAGYNNADCAYPDLTPAIGSVTSQDIAGPWVSVGGNTITINTINQVGQTCSSGVTITVPGDVCVNDYGYSGPQASTSPYNLKKVKRHYGFGTRCTSPTAGSPTCNTLSRVTIGGANATITSWSDTTITATVPASVPTCRVQQQAQYGGPTTVGARARCGELVITAGNGKQSIDAVTVTLGGKHPALLPAGSTIQKAIDAASPGDMIIVPPGTYRELLIMWKPVRLQGVGAASSIIDANAHPAGKLDPWRRSVNCLFGLSINGQPIGAGNPFDPNGSYNCPTPNTSAGGQTGPDGNVWNYFNGGPTNPTMVVDRVPLEGILGWDATVNGNLAEQLQEPSLMGAYEGAALTVLAKGVNIPCTPSATCDAFGSGAEAAFPAGTTLLTGPVSSGGLSLLGDFNPICHTSLTNTTNRYPSNFQCNPSAIDGLGLTDSSQGGGGILVHAWAHNLEIANDRIYSNAGTLSGGISVGLGESPEAYLVPDTSSPSSCVLQLLQPTNTQLPFCLNLNVDVHNNSITNNSSTGDELFSGTPAGAGGATICTGADFYKFNFNWVCGNLSTGDGGGVGHLGFSWNGDIEHNSILFNQSTNPTITTNGGGIIVMGAAPDATINGTECGSVTDNDCVPGLSDGTGPGLVINANLIMGNAAESGSGGGLRLQAVNGTDIARFPNPALGTGTACSDQAHCRWYVASVTNNIIVNNVAGWDGGGVSLEDSLVVNFVNNTVVSNDSTASAGVLFNTLGAPLASSQVPPGCQTTSTSTSCPQVAGFVALKNSPQLTSSFAGPPVVTPICPPGHANCTAFSSPVLYNNVIWQNRSFYIGVGSLGSNTQNQQNVVALYDSFTTTRAATQAATGACPAGSSYWDIGVRGDTTQAPNSGSGFTLAPMYSVLTSITGYDAAGLHNTASNPAVASQYCNGSRVPPEICPSLTNCTALYQVPPGIADATVPNPIFSLQPSATVDEGNNWINISWGPLSMTNPSVLGANGNYGGGPLLGNYTLQTTSPAINWIPCSSPVGACPVTGEVVAIPATDFFGNPRPDQGRRFDVGAVEVPLH
jgi:hypothetical protein